MSLQHRTTILLLLNQAANAVTGLLFWLLFIRVVGLDPGRLGVGYTVVAIGTALGLLAKGGLDAALIRHVPHLSDRDGRRLLAASAGTSAAFCVAGITVLAAAAYATPWIEGLTLLEWSLAAAIAVFLVVTWLQDAFFLGRGRPGATFWRTSAFSAGKLLLPLPLLLWAIPAPVPTVWMLSLAASAAVGFLLSRRPVRQAGRRLARATFFRSAWRNVLGNAAEFLPGLLLVPLVLVVSGPADAGFFSMAWTAAALLFLAAAAIGRSALSEMSRARTAAPALRRAVAQAALLITPGMLGGMLLARPILHIFGADYAAAGAPAFVILCASALFVTPTYLYLNLLRAREQTLALNLFPLALIAVLFLCAALLAIPFGVTGAALAWLLASAPFGLWAAARLHAATREVTTREAQAVGRHPHLE